MGSKFSIGLKPLRKPIICKDGTKYPYPATGNPDPADLMEQWYDIDLHFLWWDFVFSGTTEINLTTPNHWEGPVPPPTDGVRSFFTWLPASEAYNTQTWLYEAGIPVFTISATLVPYSPSPNFDTGVQPYTKPPFTGSAEYRVYNP